MTLSAPFSHFAIHPLLCSYFPLNFILSGFLPTRGGEALHAGAAEMTLLHRHLPAAAPNYFGFYRQLRANVVSCSARMLREEYLKSINMLLLSAHSRLQGYSLCCQCHVKNLCMWETAKIIQWQPWNYEYYRNWIQVHTYNSHYQWGMCTLVTSSSGLCSFTKADILITHFFPTVDINHFPVFLIID